MALRVGTEYQEIAEKLVAKYPVAFGHVEMDKVMFLSETEKSPKKYADCRKVTAPYDFMINYKYILTFYESKIVPMNEAQKVMLVFHEMLHIDSDFAKIRKHNIEDFRELVTKYGVNWDIDPNLPNILEDDEDDVPMIATEDEEAMDN